MDKRKIQRRRLHKNCNLSSASQTSSSSMEDVFFNRGSHGGVILRQTQRESNTDLLRNQINLPISSSSHNEIDTVHDNEIDILMRSHCNDNTVDKSPLKRSIVSLQTTINNEDKIQDNVQNTSARHYQADSSVKKCRVVGIHYFNHFLSQTGVTMNDDKEDFYTIDNEPVIIVKKMRQLLSCGDFNINELLQDWNSCIISNVKCLENSLNSMNITSYDENRRSSSTLLDIRQKKSVSLVKILLQVPQLQTQILNSLIQKLNETVVAADKIEDVPWTYQLLQQLRFIETIIDAELLSLKLEELLETSPIWFQRELITFLPDIVIDAQHENIAAILCRLMEIHGNLTNVILDCITNLSLSEEFQKELCEKILKLLQCNCHINKISAIIQFCLNYCTTVDLCQKVLRIIRKLELYPLNGENFDEYHTNQVLIVNSLKMSLILSTDMVNAAILVVSCMDHTPMPFDIIILLLLYDGTIKKRKAEIIFKQHVRNGHFDAKLLSVFHNNYKQVVKDLQPIALRVASNFLKLDDPILIDFSSEWLRQQFFFHGHLIHKQREIIEKLILLMGDNDQTAKSALAILCKMAKTEDEKRYLQVHCNYLRILLEKVEKFDLQEVMILNDLLYALCANSSIISDALRDDLFILLQKQLLCRRDNLTKSKGVAGAVMAIKHLTINSKSCSMAKEIFHNMLNSIKNCPRSQGFFYDKMASIIADAQNMNREFLKLITNVFEEEFINTYMTDVSTYSGEFISTFGLNNSNNDSAMCVLQFGQLKYSGAIVPGLLRLMGTCFMQITDDENLENITALLGCAILMPKDLQLPDAHVLDYLFYCVNWFRELINIFVMQSDSILQRQVFKRLDNIIDLQCELANLLMLAETRYQAPPCYFHCCPSKLPPLKLGERKILKKGKQCSAIVEDITIAATEKNKSGVAGGTASEHREKWEIATLLSTKNAMYFRHLDAKLLNLIDTSIVSNMSSTAKLSQTNVNQISINQLCFIIKELMIEIEDDADVDVSFIRDLIGLLPKICKKLNSIVKKLELEINKDHENNNFNNNQNKQAVNLILNFLTAIFRWKHFNNPNYNIMLRDGLRTLAGQMDESNFTLSSCKKLVGESYRYFETLTHVATQIQIAFALVEVCETIMKHSVSFTRLHQEKQARMAYGFLCFEWLDDRHTGLLYKSAVCGLLKHWMDHEPKPLDTVTSVLEWLPNEVKKLEKPQDKLSKLPSINKANFHHLILKIFHGLIKGTKISLSSIVSIDIKKLELWRKVADNIEGIVSVCKIITTKGNLVVYLRYMPLVLKQFLIHGMPTLERNLRYHTEVITGILKVIQCATRYLNAVCVHSTEKKDLALTKLVPMAKTTLEKLLYSVKAMLVLNNSSTAFWMGNLVNKNLEGQEVLSQISNSTDGDHISVQNAHTSDGSLNYCTKDIVNDDDECLSADLLSSDNDDMIMNSDHVGENFYDGDDNDDDDSDRHKKVIGISPNIDD